MLLNTSLIVAFGEYFNTFLLSILESYFLHFWIVMLLKNPCRGYIRYTCSSTPCAQGVLQKYIHSSTPCMQGVLEYMYIWSTTQGVFECMYIWSITQGVLECMYIWSTPCMILQIYIHSNTPCVVLQIYICPSTTCVGITEWGEWVQIPHCYFEKKR